METKLKNMLKNMENALTAASFAEEGESETAQAVLREGRRVLLALKQGRIDAKTVKYAVNTSKRIGAELDLLFVSSKAQSGPDPMLQELERQLTAQCIRYRVIRKAGCLKEAVIEYTDGEKEILFAVVESSKSLHADCAGKESGLSELWQKLKCPLVVVMDGARA